MERLYLQKLYANSATPKLDYFLDENFLNSTFDSTFYEFGELHALV